MSAVLYTSVWAAKLAAREEQAREQGAGLRRSASYFQKVCKTIGPGVLAYFGITRRYMQKKIFFGSKFYFFKKKG